MQRRPGNTAAKRFLKRLLRSHGQEPRKIVTDKLGSYVVAHRELMPDVIHDTVHNANNRAEQSLKPTHVRECVMRRFKSFRHAQQFLEIHAVVRNVFNLGRRLVRAQHYKNLREGTLEQWATAVA